MGSPRNEWERRSEEGPQHRVVIPEPFYLGKHEVTQEQWEAVMGYNISQCRGPDRPVDTVSWYDCEEFVARMNDWYGGQGLHFRLPSEAEWEYACRAGTTTAWSFGNDVNRLQDYAWFSGNSNDRTHPVGRKKPNPWGLYDMHGNVAERCADRYPPGVFGADYTTLPINPALNAPAEYGIDRGGSYFASASGTRCAARGWSKLHGTCSFVGFRLAATICRVAEPDKK